MKNLKNLLILSVIATYLLSSCNSSVSIVKRKYNDGYYVSTSHHTNTNTTVTKEENNINKQETAKGIENDNTTTADNAVSEKAGVPNASIQTDVTSIVSDNTKEVTHTQKSAVERKAGSKKMTAAEMMPFVLKKQVSKIAQKAPQRKEVRSSEILEIILAIFLPPVAVYLHTNGLTTEFWIDLILTCLFWVPGVIYAFYIVLTQ
jgi:uncharacterized membrane protein YqaE (UPF0057 family)